MKKNIYRVTGGFTCHLCRKCKPPLIINNLQLKMQDFPLFSLVFSCHYVIFSIAHQQKNMFLQFLKEFAELSPSEQRVFLFCLENCPHPRRYTGDLRKIQQNTHLSRLTVYQALNHISNLPHLRKAVCYIRTDISELLQDEYRDLLGRGGVLLSEGGLAGSSLVGEVEPLEPCR